jgi:hypothetical protein
MHAAEPVTIRPIHRLVVRPTAEELAATTLRPQEISGPYEGARSEEEEYDPAPVKP